jgi:hypothetical protein
MTMSTTQTRQGEATTIKVSGKDYITVAERVRLVTDGAGYSIVDADIFPLLERWFYRVRIKIEDRTYIGTAEIKFGARSGADASAPVECAETSAIGRALAFAGIGVVDGIASADEVARQNAPEPRQQAAKPTPAPVPPSAPVDADSPFGDERPTYNILSDIKSRQELNTIGVRSVEDIDRWLTEEKLNGQPLTQELVLTRITLRKAQAAGIASGRTSHAPNALKRVSVPGVRP